MALPAAKEAPVLPETCKEQEAFGACLHHASLSCKGEVCILAGHCYRAHIRLCSNPYETMEAHTGEKDPEGETE